MKMKSHSLLFRFNISLLIWIAFISSSFADENVINSGSRKKRIVNGIEAKAKEFPYAMQLYSIRKDQAVCTGALISEQSILTAANCVIDDDRFPLYVYPTEDFYGQFGSIEDNIVTFKEFRVYKGYDVRRIAAGVSILIINEPYKTKGYIQPVALPEKGMNFEGEELFAVGWGRSKKGEAKSTNSLRYMETEIEKTDEICVKKFSLFNKKYHICVNQDDGVCMYVGDSGGPLVKKGADIDVSVGVATYGLDDETCGGRTVMYLSTSATYEWIKYYAVGKVTFLRAG